MPFSNTREGKHSSGCNAGSAASVTIRSIFSGRFSRNHSTSVSTHRDSTAPGEHKTSRCSHFSNSWRTIGQTPSPGFLQLPLCRHAEVAAIAANLQRTNRLTGLPHRPVKAFEERLDPACPRIVRLASVAQEGVVR